MRVVRPTAADVRNLFMNVTFHAYTYRRVKLGEIADFHAYFVIPSEVEESLIIFLRSVHPTIRDASRPLSMTIETRRYRQTQSRRRLVLAQVFLRVHCCCATRSGCCHGLLVNAISHVARNEHTGVSALDQLLGDQITVRIHVELAAIGLCVGIVTR